MEGEKSTQAWCLRIVRSNVYSILAYFEKTRDTISVYANMYVGLPSNIPLYTLRLCDEIISAKEQNQ